MTRGKAQTKIGMYISRDQTRVLLKKTGKLIHWNGSLQELQGCPSLDIFQDNDKEKGVTSSYQQEIVKQFSLNKSNEMHIIVDDEGSYNSPYTVTQYETAEDLANAIQSEPSSIITNWKNYAQNTEYLWEILTMDMQPLRGAVKLPKKVLLCGISEEKAIAAATWAKTQNQTLTNIYPISVALLRWAAKNGPDTPFFFVTQTDNEVVIAHFVDREIRNILPVRTKDGITFDEMNDIDEMTEEEEGKNTTIWGWGISLGSHGQVKLAARYKHLRLLTAEDLRGSNPLDIKGDPKVQHPEAWLLNDLIA